MDNNSPQHTRFEKEACCVVIPTYNNDKTLGHIINGVLNFTNQVIVVNDGSTDNTGEVLKGYSQIDIIHLPHNKGKGYAIRKGFEWAREKGYCLAITIDSDGQHQAEDLPLFLDRLQDEPGSLIIGARNLDLAGVPGGSTFGNKFSNFWFWVETGLKLPDTQSGYRLYPLEAFEKMRFASRRFEFEVEVLVRAAWKGIPIESIPISVYYAPKGQRISHFRPFLDFFRISILNTFLVLISFLCIKPYEVMRNINGENIRNFFKRELLNPDESNFKKAASVSLGIFMGIAPIWGWQTAASIGLAFILRLNKIITVAAANISIPPMLPFILWASYKTGGLILDNHKEITYSSGLTFEFFKDNFIQYILGALVFGVLFALVCGLVTFILLNIFRKKPVVVPVQVDVKE